MVYSPFTSCLARNPISVGGFIKIDDEWMQVQKKDTYQLEVTRGARNSGTAGHSQNAEVLYGETVSETIYLPVETND